MCRSSTCTSLQKSHFPSSINQMVLLPQPNTHIDLTIKIQETLNPNTKTLYYWSPVTFVLCIHWPPYNTYCSFAKAANTEY